MGNCINKESSMQWGGDDWSEDYSAAATGNHRKINQLYGQNYNNYKKISKEEEMIELPTTSNDIVYTQDNMKVETTQVKLKITRKQLEELLGESTRNIKGVDQVLARLININMHDFHYSHQHHSWRPHLPTITEL